MHSGLIVGEQPAETEALLEALRPLTEKPLIVKLTPNVANPAEVAVAAEQGGADAVSLINTLKASAIDPATGEPGIAAGHGGLSGPAVRPVAVAQVRAVAAAVASRSSAWAGSQAGPMRSKCSPPGPPWSRSEPRTSATRGRAAGWRARSPERSEAGRGGAPIGNTA